MREKSYCRVCDQTFGSLSVGHICKPEGGRAVSVNKELLKILRMVLQDEPNNIVEWYKKAHPEVWERYKKEQREALKEASEMFPSVI